MSCWAFMSVILLSNVPSEIIVRDDSWKQNNHEWSNYVLMQKELKSSCYHNSQVCTVKTTSLSEYK